MSIETAIKEVRANAEALLATVDAVKNAVDTGNTQAAIYGALQVAGRAGELIQSSVTLCKEVMNAVTEKRL